MVTRRKFILQSAVVGIGSEFNKVFPLMKEEVNYFSYESSYVKLTLRRNQPVFSFFSTDSLGGGNFTVNPILEKQIVSSGHYKSSVVSDSITYSAEGDKSSVPVWKLQVHPKSIEVRTRWNKVDSSMFILTFAQKINHCTVLGVMEGENRMKFPCLLHFPGMGTFKIYCDNPEVTLFYDADRYVNNPYVKIGLPVATNKQKDISYRFESVAIYPNIKSIAKNDRFDRFDGFRRNFINIFQINPRKNILANNSASDNCAFTLYLYAEMAKKTPELVEGVTAMDLIRNTLDKYIGGVKGYGQIGYKNIAGGWQSEYDSSDSWPSLIISACEYILTCQDNHWALKNYDSISDWTKKMMATDTNEDGIIEYGYSGNSGSWDGIKRPANWWDTIGFGHDDAYSNALAYRACVLMERVSQIVGKPEDLILFKTFSSKLKKNYYPTFYNQNTGVLAGWKSKDGQLHDYYFTFINSVAICYGLIEEDKAREILTHILRKMKEVGFTDFRLGLPGNLLPVTKADYTDRNKRFGYGAFQVYENGGATGCYVYFMIHALYKLGMKNEADDILIPLLESYKENGFQGNCPGSSMTRDWKTWNGKCWGYEGFLVDNYLALLGVFDYLDKKN